MAEDKKGPSSLGGISEGSKSANQPGVDQPGAGASKGSADKSVGEKFGAGRPGFQSRGDGKPGSDSAPDEEKGEIAVKEDVSYGTVGNITTGRPGENPAPPPGDEAKDAGPDVNYDAGRPVRPGEVKTGMRENAPAGALGKDDISDEMKATMPEYAGQRAEERQQARRERVDEDRKNDRLKK